MIGQTLSHYRLLDTVGQGGMGVVYRARDERLDREVAIKVLPEGALSDPHARRRFHDEARALSRVNHPNVATLYDFDSQDGVDFLVMELVGGHPLAERIQAGPLPEPEVVALGAQLADGLAAAHRAHVLHRDIKPANLHVAADGRLKILDFGLSRALGPDPATLLTQSVPQQGMLTGTPSYLAPEQVTGDALDERTDVHGAGLVLYEMACGRRAFPQSPPALFYAIAHEPPPAPTAIGAKVSPALEGVILRCLAKDKAARTPSARALADDLAALARGAAPVVARAPQSRTTRRFAFAAAVAAVAIALLFAGMWMRGRLGGAAAPGGEVKSLAVLPLSNLSGDRSQDYFAEGMTDELITRLAEVGALRVISRSSVMQYRGTTPTLKSVADRLHADYVVEGTVAREGDSVRVAAHLVDARKDRQLWAESYQRDGRHVLALQSELARAIVERVAVQLTASERGRLASARAVEPAAHEAYLRGLAQMNTYSAAGFANAIAQFQESIRIDPGYAPAHAALATTYGYVSGISMPADQAMPRARAAALNALAVDPDLAAAHAALGYVKQEYDWDWDGAEQSYLTALRHSPNDLTAHASYGTLLVMLGRFDEAIAQFTQARGLDPLSSLVAGYSLWPYFEGRRWDQAVARAREVIQADPSVSGPHMVLGQALLFRGDHGPGVAELERAVELDPGNPFPLGWLGFGYAYAGRTDDARKVLRRMDASARTGYVQPYLYALVHAGLGEKDEAIRWLERAFQARSDELGMLNVDPGMDGLRGDPRFQALFARMKFPPRPGVGRVSLRPRGCPPIANSPLARGAAGA